MLNFKGAKMNAPSLVVSNFCKKLTGLFLISSVAAVGTGCTPTPPDYRAQVTAPAYEAGDARNGEKLYEELCSQCHTLRPGSNKKGPQTRRTNALTRLIPARATPPAADPRPPCPPRRSTGLREECDRFWTARRGVFGYPPEH